MTLVDDPVTSVPSLDVTSVAPQVRRKLGGPRRGSMFNLVGALAAGFCIAMLLGFLTALSGVLGLVIVTYLAFIAVYGVLVFLSDDGPAVRDAVMTVLMASCAVLAFGALGLVVVFTIARG